MSDERVLELHIDVTHLPDWLVAALNAGGHIEVEEKITGRFLTIVSRRLIPTPLPPVVDGRNLARMYHDVHKAPEEGSIEAAVRRHAQACGLVAYVMNVHPDKVAQAVKDWAGWSP